MGGILLVVLGNLVVWYTTLILLASFVLLIPLIVPLVVLWILARSGLLLLCLLLLCLLFSLASGHRWKAVVNFVVVLVREFIYAFETQFLLVRRPKSQQKFAYNTEET